MFLLVAEHDRYKHHGQFEYFMIWITMFLCWPVVVVVMAYFWWDDRKQRKKHE
jgi:hypothetical protein